MEKAQVHYLTGHRQIELTKQMFRNVYTLLKYPSRTGVSQVSEV